MSPLFRKRETYNEQMLREAGLDRVRFRQPEPPPEPAPQPYVADKINLGPVVGLVDSGPLAWDCVVSIHDSAIAGDSVDFVVLPNGDLIVESEQGDADLSSLADAIEEKIDPPYRASANRHGVDLWTAGAKRIYVEELAFPEGNALELSQHDGLMEFRVDGDVSESPFPVQLHRVGEAFGANFSVSAERIDGDYWEVKVSPL